MDRGVARPNQGFTWPRLWQAWKPAPPSILSASQHEPHVPIRHPRLVKEKENKWWAEDKGPNLTWALCPRYITSFPFLLESWPRLMTQRMGREERKTRARSFEPLVFAFPVPFSSLSRGVKDGPTHSHVGLKDQVGREANVSLWARRGGVNPWARDSCFPSSRPILWAEHEWVGMGNGWYELKVRLRINRELWF